MLYKKIEVKTHLNKLDDQKRIYNINIGNKIWKEILESYISSSNYRRVALVIDRNVSEIYKDEVSDFLNRLSLKGFLGFVHVIEASEHTKNLVCFEEIINYLMINEFSRKDLLVAIGGGVIGDLTGFVASTYVRGIDLIQVPTTLLSQLDSSVGGKVAINYRTTKNLLGAFYNPVMVIIDILFLRSLSEKIFVEGLAEGLKVAFLKGDIGSYKEAWLAGLIGFYKSNAGILTTGFDDYELKLMELIEEAISYKREIVEVDPLETGVRVNLNFGHTIGHALEALGKGKWLHGEAIALGMLLEQLVGENLEICDSMITKELNVLLKELGLPYTLSPGAVKGIDLMPYLILDKKNTGDYISLVLLEKMGHPRLVKINKKDFVETLDIVIRMIEK